MSLNVRFENCLDFVKNMRQIIEANPTDWRNIYTEEALAYAECDLMEMELEAASSAEEYDSVLNENNSRKGRNRKAKQNGKRNADKAKRLHKTDRYHGKSLEPYLYKEDGVIKESIEMVYHKCRMPISDRVHNKFTLKADAREQDFYTDFDTEINTEAKTAESIEEEGCFEDFLWYLIEKLPEEKFIVLYNFDNGKKWEDHRWSTDQFKGVMTKDEIIKRLMETALRNDTEIEVNDEVKTKGLKGICFNWDFGTDEYWNEWNGYERLTIIPVSELNN